MTAQKTRCPFCESIFAVTAEQLAARGGHVRCGKCFQVFKADDHLVNEDSNSTPPSPDSLFDYLDQQASAPDTHDVTLAGQSKQQRPPDHVATAEPAEHPIHHAAALDRPSDMDDDFEGIFSGLAPVEVDPDQGYGHSAQANLTKGVPAQTLAVPDAVVAAPAKALIEPISKLSPNTTHSMKSLFDDMLQDDTDNTTTSVESNSLKLDSEFSDLFLGDNSIEMNALQRDELVGVDKLHAAADESWAEALLQEEQKKAPVLPTATPQQASRGTNRQAMPSSPQRNTAVPLPTEMIDDIPIGEQLAGASSRPSLTEDEDLLSYLSRTGAAQGDEMIPLTAPRSNSSKSSNASPLPASHRVLTPTKTPVALSHYIIWGLMCMLMLMLLLAQFAYFNFERLAADPAHYQQMRHLCRIAGCHVPVIDASQIKISKVTARKHPNQAKVTRFSVTLTNQALETQPLPALKLTLREQGEISAGRLIQPTEYLQGAAAGLTRLPPNMPMKVSFDIQMPRRDVGTFAIDPTYQ
jgi:predicted Zn finger-like uncharacterized protein